MESPNKRMKPSNEGEDFVSLDVGDGEASKYGYGNEEEDEQNPTHDDAPPSNAPRGPKAQYQRDARFDRRNAQDRPKSRHALPGHEPWVLVKTKFGRRFVHNTKNRESFWRIPDDVWPAVREFEASEKQQKAREENAKWAEQELQSMRQQSKAADVNKKADAEESRSRRRRSESLQREDEEAMMAELAAEAEKAEEQDVKSAVKEVDHQVGETGYDSEGSFEYVEVTDDEDEEGDEGAENSKADADGEAMDTVEQAEDGPVEFGEDDIAFQLAAMGAEYGLDEGEYGEPPEEGWEEGAEGLAISDEDAANLFKDLLDDYRVSPFTPFDKIIADESETSILNDDRYTILSSMKMRRQVFDDWAREKAAQIKDERAKMEKRDPRIPYLALLSEKATPKLYWPEFKRKFKKEPEMNDRKLSEKDREKLYRDHINRLKLPESTRKGDLLTLLKSVPLRDLNNATTLDALPQQLCTHLHLISLPASTRNQTLSKYISSLPPPPEAGDLTDEQRTEEEKKRAEKRRREDALAERQRKVDEEKRKAGKEERWAKRDLREEEAELRRAMDVGRGSLRAALSEGV